MVRLKYGGAPAPTKGVQGAKPPASCESVPKARVHSLCVENYKFKSSGDVRISILDNHMILFLLYL